MAIVIILILGLVLRLISLNQSLWLDEAVQAITSRGSFSGIFTELTGDFHPPLYHILMWGWVRIFGSSEVALRMPSVIFGVATVWIVYLIAKSYLPALFLATAPFHIYYSQEARPYALVTFLISLSWYCFLKMGNQGWKVAYIVSTTLALYASYYTFLIILAQGLVVFWRRKFGQIKFLLLLLIFLFPWLPMFVIQLKTGVQATQILPEWGKLVNLSVLKAIPLTFIKFSLGRITIFNKKLYALVAGVILLVYGGVGVRSFRRGAGNILCWLGVPIFISWLISFFVPNYQPFRLLFVLPAFYLMLALGISEFENKRIRQVLIAFVLAVNFTSWVIYAFNPYFHREDWRGVVKYIETTTEQDKLAILPSETSNWPWRYYTQNRGVRLVVAATDINKVSDDWLVTENINKVKKVYYIRYLVPLFDPEEKISSWLKEIGFVKIKEVSFNQIPLWIYQREEKYAHRD